MEKSLDVIRAINYTRRRNMLPWDKLGGDYDRVMTKHYDRAKAVYQEPGEPNNTGYYYDAKSLAHQDSRMMEPMVY